ncbi:MAG: protein-S-isoprenylcysteine O-methyltransferase [Bdellovibrionota bacterium]
MNPWYGKALFLVGVVVTVFIRAPHDSRNKKVRVAEDRKGPMEIFLLVVMGISCMLLPILWMSTSLLSFADYPLTPWALGAGAACLAMNFWLFHRSHADLGTNWSVTLQVREGHQLVSSGIYKRIRHPMYSSIYCNVLAQAFLLPNWIAGMAGLIGFTMMFAFRLRPEEQMMIDQFGDQYRAYASRTKRLIPGIW